MSRIKVLLEELLEELTIDDLLKEAIEGCDLMEVIAALDVLHANKDGITIKAFENNEQVYPALK